ncbi:MAG: hypothetical protein AB2421_12870, partial [Thermotaleaceae bacterium]
PKHPSAKNIMVGVIGSTYVEFYCKHCKETYLAYISLKADDSETFLQVKIEKKENKKQNLSLLINDTQCKLYTLEEKN